MPGLFENAVQSIQLGVEDYEAKDQRRALSAVRNFHAGVVLLAKEVLVRKVPNADESDVIAARYKPMPDDSGGVRFEAESDRTIDLATIGRRFKDFGLSIDQSTLKELTRVRNEVEHHYPKVPHDVVRQIISKAFPIALQLFRLAEEEPNICLGEAWQTMLDVHTVYEQELDACHATFKEVIWHTWLLEEPSFSCPNCLSDLVAHDNPENHEQESIDAHCRSCGTAIGAEALVENGLGARLEAESYFAMRDGNDPPLQRCPECGLETYVLFEEEVGCVWCGCTLGSCSLCSISLMPNNVDYMDHDMCSYCGNLMRKDD